MVLLDCGSYKMITLKMEFNYRLFYVGVLWFCIYKTLVCCFYLQQMKFFVVVVNSKEKRPFDKLTGEKIPKQHLLLKIKLLKKRFGCSPLVKKIIFSHIIIL